MQGDYLLKNESSFKITLRFITLQLLQTNYCLTSNLVGTRQYQSHQVLLEDLVYTSLSTLTHTPKIETMQIKAHIPLQTSTMLSFHHKDISRFNDGATVIKTFMFL